MLANQRSEPDTPKKSPIKSTQVGGLLTPGTGTGRAPIAGRNWDLTRTPTKARKTSAISSDEESYSWDESLDNEVGSLIGSSRLRQPVFAPTTPSKTPRTAAYTSPGKRKLDDLDDQPPPYSESVSTPQSSVTVGAAPFSSMEVSATPTPRRYRDVLSAGPESSQMSELASNILSILDRHDVVVPVKARDEIVASLDQTHLKTQGIIRGRDISRLALKKKDEEIKHLKERIEKLETEREMDKVVITCLRSGASSK